MLCGLLRGLLLGRLLLGRLLRGGLQRQLPLMRDVHGVLASRQGPSPGGGGASRGGLDRDNAGVKTEAHSLSGHHGGGLGAGRTRGPGGLADRGRETSRRLLDDGGRRRG